MNLKQRQQAHKFREKMSQILGKHPDSDEVSTYVKLFNEAIIDDDPSGLKCSYCGEDALLEDSSVVYGKSYGQMWVCRNYPECDAYVGCHKDSNVALGTLANRELRVMRRVVHSELDVIWKTKVLTRKETYKKLRKRMNLGYHDCHIAKFDVETCKNALGHIFQMQTELGVNSIRKQIEEEDDENI